MTLLSYDYLVKIKLIIYSVNKTSYIKSKK